MKIAIVGTGYVGLVSGVCLASLGHQVTCVDKDFTKIKNLRNGVIPIYEPGLSELLKKVENNINFTDNLGDALIGCKAIFIAVGTPQDEDGSADLKYVIQCAEEIVEKSKDDKVIITKSTVPVHTGEKIKKITDSRKDIKFYIASNPEFLREGCAIFDFINPDRIVIGSNDDYSKDILLEIYSSFSIEKIVTTDIATAELIKYASNSFLATKISFINEMADLCEKTGASIKNLSYAIGLDSRIGNKFLNAGPGFGGSCFPKDIMAIVNMSKKYDCKLSLIESVIDSNKIRQEKMSKKIVAILDNQLSNKNITFLGLAFKGNTDDTRYSPSISIIKKIARNNCIIKVNDFQALENAKKDLAEFNNIRYHQDPYEACTDSDLIVIATEWNEYSKLDYSIIFSKARDKKILDLRNILDGEKIQKIGFKYFAIGKKND